MEITKSNMKRHKKLHTIHTMFQCEDCGLAFNTKSVLKVHMSGVHSKKLTSYKTVLSGPDHDRRRGKRPVTGDFSKEALEKFASEGLISITRQKTRKNEFGKKKRRGDPESCNICKESFDDEDALLSHAHTEHNGKRYMCDVCQAFTAKTVGGINNHKLNSHDIAVKDMTYFTCLEDGCNFKSTNATNIIGHVNSFHLGKGGFLCQFCGKSFTSKTYI